MLIGVLFVHSELIWLKDECLKLSKSVTFTLMGLNLYKPWLRILSKLSQQWQICCVKSLESKYVVALYRWGSTGPLPPATAGSSPPPPRSDGRCCKALLNETQKKESCQSLKYMNVVQQYTSGPNLSFFMTNKLIQ